MRTLKSKLKLSGNGLMSNMPCEFEICPSKEKGIRFHVKNSIICAKTENVVSTDHCIVLANPKADTRIMLVEHFMAACAISRIDALDIYVNGEGFETPIFDGSAKVWVNEFDKTGYEGEVEPTEHLAETVVFKAGKSSIVLIPSEKTTITYAVNFNHPELRYRWVTLNENIDEIIEARTFGYLKDLETFQKMGFSKGVTYENTVGLTDNGYTTELRSEFEPVKHKILDIIGDFYLTGYNPLELNADFLVKEAGHGYHVAAAKILEKTLN
ncbi:MAG: UDP-3-O-acyl-N-acetylglucosamine deacetylase [Candidatus Gastranaerophilales bacterium]|nr:UDP-3-O-acyl-N-acetylglucosamine deacetylase [Candidatus Gastranaerophilales bacterium]